MNESGYRFIETVCPWTSGHISTPPYMPIDGLLVGHINVPGNACGLDIYPSWSPDAIGPVQYLPHNVDGTQQAYLILCLWTYWYNAAAATLRAQQELRDKAHAPPDRYMYRHYTYGFPDDD